MDGVIKDVVVRVRETPDGRYHNDLSRDMDAGARWMLASSPVMEAGARQAPARASVMIIALRADDRNAPPRCAR
jgi:hypothetical protein